MGRTAGFTLIELMVVVALIGIMSLTAVPVYQTYQQRAYGSQAALMSKRLIDAQIIYYLEHNKFFPENGQMIEIYPDDPPGETSQKIRQIEKALNISIPVSHVLKYQIWPYDETSDSGCQVLISANFRLFKNGGSPGSITRTVNKDGQVDTIVP